MAEHHQIQNAKQTNEAAHPRRTTPPVEQSPVELTLQADQVVSVQRAIADPRAASPRDMLALQRVAGNRAVTRLIQTKLSVGPAGDRFEQEANRVAEQVVSGQSRRGASHLSSVIQRVHDYLPTENYQNISVGMFSPAMDNSGAFVGSEMKRREKAERQRLQGGNWFTRRFKPRPSEVDVRVNLLAPAMQRAYAPIQAASAAGQTLAIFMAPEWYFKRPKTPYTEADKDLIIQKLRALSAGYPNMLIIPGSIVWRGVVGGQMVIKNTAPVIMNGNLLRVHDKNVNAGDTDSYRAEAAAEYERGKGTDSNFFNIGNVKFAIEICGDHSSSARARNEYVAHPPPGTENGVDVHILISHGAPFQAPKNLARQGGFALQSDASPHGVGTDLGHGEKPLSIGASKLATATGAQKQAARKYYDLEVPDLRKTDDLLDATFMGEFSLATGARLQPKLLVGPTRDRYEQEAERVADQVVGGQPSAVSPAEGLRSGPPAQRQAQDEEEVQTKPLAASITPLVQRQVGVEEEDVQTKPLLQRQAEEEEIQMLPSPVRRGAWGEVQRQGDGGFEAGRELESRLAAHKGGGSPLPQDVRAYMEPRFGADFSRVRLHTGDEATDLNRSLSAQAFTHGQDIYLGAGRYDPSTTAGKRLLAHELTHVVQQTGGQVQRKSKAGRAKTGLKVRIGGGAGKRIQRKYDTPLDIQKAWPQLKERTKNLRESFPNLEKKSDAVVKKEATILDLQRKRAAAAPGSGQEAIDKTINTATNDPKWGLVALRQTLKDALSPCLAQAGTLVNDLKDLKNSATRLVPAIVEEMNKELRIFLFDMARLESYRKQAGIVAAPRSLRQIATDLGVDIPAMPAPLAGPESLETISSKHFTGITTAIMAPTFANFSFVNPELAQQEQQAQAALGGAAGDLASHLRARITVLQGKIREAYDYYLIQNANFGGTALGVFVGTEFYFTGSGGQPYAAENKATMYNAMQDLSKSLPNMLIMPGTIVWRNAGKVSNTAATFLNGTKVHEYDKKNWGGELGGEFQPGAADQSQSFSIGNITFAIDICQDVNMAMAKQQYYAQHAGDATPAKGVDVHIVTSGGQRHGATKTVARPGGLAIRSDSATAGKGAELYQIGQHSFVESRQLVQQGLVGLGGEFSVSTAAFALGASPDLASAEAEARNDTYQDDDPNCHNLKDLDAAPQQVVLLKILNFLQRVGQNAFPDMGSATAKLTIMESSIVPYHLRPANQALAEYVKEQIGAYIRPGIQEEKISTKGEEAKTDAVGLRKVAPGTIDTTLTTMHSAKIGELVGYLIYYAESHLRRNKKAPSQRLDNMRKLAQRIIAHQERTRGRYHRQAQTALARLNQVKKKSGLAGWWTSGKK